MTILKRNSEQGRELVNAQYLCHDSSGYGPTEMTLTTLGHIMLYKLKMPLEEKMPSKQMVLKIIMDREMRGQLEEVAQALVWESQDLSSCSGSDTYSSCHFG